MPEARHHLKCPINWNSTSNPSQRPNKSTMLVKININGSERETTAIIDPHSTYTILTWCPDLRILGEKIEIAQEKAKGRFITEPISINDKATNGDIIYVKTFPKTILGWKQLHDLGLMNADMRRHFVIDVPPVLIRTDRDPGKSHRGDLGNHLLSGARRIIASWVRKGLIERCDSVCNSCISLATKPNGKVNIIFHYGDLNKRSVKEPGHPQLNIVRATEAITLGKYYTVFKLFYAEWQIPLDTYTKYKTAFTFLGKQYVWNRLPAKFQNTASRLSEALEKVLDHLPQNMRKRVTYYSDVILVSAETKEECNTFSEKLQGHLMDNSFEIRPTQSWCQPKVTFLGLEITEGGIKLDTKFITKVKKITWPENTRDLKSILSRLNYANRYTPGFGIYSDSLSKLTGKTKFHWDDKSMAALDGLKDLVLLNRLVIPRLAENEACTVEIFVKNEAWMAQILNSAGKTFRFGSGLFPPLKEEDSFPIKELKAMKEIWKTYKYVLENREVEWKVESSDIVRYKDDPDCVPHGKRLNLDVLKSPGCRIKTVDPGTRKPPIPWPEIL